jgi:hypothetical protein
VLAVRTQLLAPDLGDGPPEMGGGSVTALRYCACVLGANFANARSWLICSMLLSMVVSFGDAGTASSSRR